MKKLKRLLDSYCFPGFHPLSKLKGIFGDPKARIIKFIRSQKKQFVEAVAHLIRVIMTIKLDLSEIFHLVMSGYTWKLKLGELTV